jgi:methylphosphotriester-DNA--protein-cysteine methyltransferase
MPLQRSGDLRDRKDATLPNATSRSFWLNGSAWEFPTYENIETFVDRLVRSGLVQEDRTAAAAIRGEVQSVTTRTEQRRVLQITGLSRGAIHQIERARRAVLDLRQGAAILDVSHALGYYDQAHLTRSLQRFIGQSPARIARGQEQLSLLYNK